MIWCLFGRGPGSWIRVDRSDVWSLITNSVGNSCIIVLLFFWFIVYLFECLICFLFSVICASCFWCNEFFLSLYCLGTLSLSNTSQFGATCSAMLTDVLSWVRFVLLRDNVPKQYKPKNNSHAITKNINNINISIGSDLVRQVAIRLLLLFVFMASRQDRENGSEPETVKGEILSPVEDDCSEVKVESPELLEQFRLWLADADLSVEKWPTDYHIYLESMKPVVSKKTPEKSFPLWKISHDLHKRAGWRPVTAATVQWKVQCFFKDPCLWFEVIYVFFWSFVSFRIDGLYIDILIIWLLYIMILCILIFLNIYNINILQDIRYKI